MRFISILSKTRTYAGDDGPVGAELHAVDVLIERELQEAVDLQFFGEHIAHPGTEKKKPAAAILGLGVASCIAGPVERIQLEHHAEFVGCLDAVSQVERGAPARLEVGPAVERLLNQHIREP